MLTALEQVEVAAATGRKAMEATTAMMWFTVMTMATPGTDNVSEANFDYSISTSLLPDKSWSSSSSSSSASSSMYISPTVKMAFYVANVVIAVTGLLANAYVLLALLFSKNSSSSTVNAAFQQELERR